MQIAWQVYRRLAQAFPHEFKLAYGADMMQVGEDALAETARRQGAAGLMRLIADIAMRLPVEYLSEMRQDLRYALRALIKSPGFALVGVVSMGLGIGLTTNVYSSRWALLTREMPSAANASRLVLSAIGLAGVTAYAVAQRRREIGIRMALGAQKGQVLRLVLREGTTLIATGMVIGFMGAVAMARALSAVTSELADAFRFGTNDPRLLVGAPLLLAALAMFACYVPARAAAKIDPLKALRQE